MISIWHSPKSYPKNYLNPSTSSCENLSWITSSKCSCCCCHLHTKIKTYRLISFPPHSRSPTWARCPTCTACTFPNLNHKKITYVQSVVLLLLDTLDGLFVDWLLFWVIFGVLESVFAHFENRWWGFGTGFVFHFQSTKLIIKIDRLSQKVSKAIAYKFDVIKYLFITLFETKVDIELRTDI